MTASPGRELKPCGTRAAYRRHLRYGEQPCDDCRQAEAAGGRETHGWKPFQAAQCGTQGGYQRHRRRGENACEACRRANADAQAVIRARRRAAAADAA